MDAFLKRTIVGAFMFAGAVEGLPIVAVQSSTNVTHCYEFLNFQPSAENCAVMVQICDIQICFTNTGPLTANLDERLVRMLNSITPQPQVLAFAGDLCNSLNRSPGFQPVLPAGSNELVAAKNELNRLTNYGAFYAVPGNHDCVTGDYTGTYWTNIMQISRYTNFTLAGMPVIMLDSQFQGYIDPEQAEWLFGLRRKTDRTKPILLMQHLPAVQAGSSFGRESQNTILRFLDGWKAPVWIGVGHTHGRGGASMPYQSTMIRQVYTASVNARLSPDPNPLGGTGASFSIWCITNGNVRAIISGSLTNETYYVLAEDMNYAEVQVPVTDLTNVLFFAFEGHFKREDFCVTADGPMCRDCNHWWIYTQRYQCKLPGDRFPEATRGLFALSWSTNGINCYLGANGTNWTACPWEFYKSGIGAVAIPPSLRGAPIYMKVEGQTNQPGDWITEFYAAGFGMATTNIVSASEAPVILTQNTSAGVAVTWPLLATDFMIESATRISSGEWVPMTDGTNGKVVPLQGDGKVFRLRRLW